MENPEQQKAERQNFRTTERQKSVTEAIVGSSSRTSREIIREKMKISQPLLL
jgi:hypothetical protein